MVSRLLLHAKDLQFPTVAFSLAFKINNLCQSQKQATQKNVANFEDFISFNNGYGATYNPTKAAIKLANLNTLLTQAKADLSNVTVKSVAYNNAANARMILFEPLRSLSTRLLNAFIATDANTEIVKDAKTVNRKIQGKRAKTIVESTDPAVPPPNTISASQQSYDQLIEHFNTMVEILKSEPTYAPNETDLKIVTLTALIASFKASNLEVSNAYTAISNARLSRDKTLYKANTGVYDIVGEVKSYVKSLFGATSPEYKQLTQLKFTKPKTL